jgi:hypothetical protein
MGSLNDLLSFHPVGRTGNPCLCRLLRSFSGILDAMTFLPGVREHVLLRRKIKQEFIGIVTP